MKTLKSVILIALFIVVSSDNTFSQSPGNSDYNAQSKSIIVPQVKESKVVIDGIFSTVEWDGAIHFPISEKVEIYFMASSGNLYVGWKFIGEFLGEAVSEIYIALDSKEFYNLHSSGASGEGVNRFSDDFKSTKFSVGNNKDWESNPGKTGEVACYGKEYRISLTKFGSTSLKFAGGIIFVNSSMRETAHFPQSYDFKNPDKWIELIFPSVFPGLTSPYLGQQPPSLTPELFAPGIVSTGLDELNSVFSPDGTEFYFCVRKPGAVSIFQIKLEHGIWSKPALLPFASRFCDIDVSLSPDGSKMFFSSKRPVSEKADPKSDYDFWVVEHVGKDWGKPIHLGTEINSDRDDFYPMMAKDGTLYFSSQREGPGTNNIYRSKLINGHYLTAEKLDSTINSAYRDFDPYISPDESLLIFASARPDGFGAEDLYISFRKADGSWTPAKNMGDKINSPGAEYCPMLSPDGKFLFFTSARRTPISFPDQPLSYHEFESQHNLPQNVFSDVYWVDAKIIVEFKPNN